MGVEGCIAYLPLRVRAAPTAQAHSLPPTHRTMFDGGGGSGVVHHVCDNNGHVKSWGSGRPGTFPLTSARLRSRKLVIVSFGSVLLTSGLFPTSELGGHGLR